MEGNYDTIMTLQLHYLTSAACIRAEQEAISYYRKTYNKYIAYRSELLCIPQRFRPFRKEK